ncbi:MAG: class I SAM-dependent RNA methyltransferase [Pyrinomonadaceae bacterium]|nr:class I SAM-dependent RNA methyltransferase [Pyrinomonadaceae bacterium]
MRQEEKVVKIEKIVPNGYGLAFTDGLTVFVSLAVKDDLLRVRIREKKGKVAFAEIIEIIEPSPDRIEPPCQYFGTCGGCDFQQMNYQAQLQSKVEIIRDCLKRIGKIDFPGEIPIVGSPKEFNYRSRAQWHADTRKQNLGYFKRYSHNVIDVEKCPILDEKLQETLTDLRQNLSWGEFWAESVEIETATNGEKVSVYSAEIIEPTEKISFEALGNRYFYNAESFFQGNLGLIEPLIKTAIEGAKGNFALDLFCGVGLFSLPLARQFGKVIGVESNEKAIDFAKENAENARLDNLEFYAEETTAWLTENNPQNIDFVLLDPPRSGAEKETIEAILKLKPTQISYVSCDPATLARDLRILCEFYQIESITAFDLFCQTSHVETVVKLQLSN